MRRIRTLIAGACMVIPTLFGLAGTNAAYADTVDIASVSPVTGSIETYVNEDIPDNDELFSGYVEQVFGAGSGVSLYGSKAGDGLDASAKQMYDLLKADITKVAAGELTSSVFTYTTEDIDFKTSWTAAELGVSSTVVNGAINNDATAAIKKYISDKCFADISTYLDALLADCPYELYWYDKVNGTGGTYSTGSIIPEYKNGEYVLKCSPYVIFKMNVAKEYSATNTSGTTDLLASKTGAAMNAADNARKLVKDCEPLSDYYKMLAYKKYICNQVAYNHDAAASSSTPYGNPWQMIYVFDNDPDTKVVCEGYSKAFQYLCDMSQFNNESLYSILVTGTMDGGAHMWNIVHVDDKNYLVDITNCDGRQYGESEELFMRGYASGDVRSGYTIHIPRIDWIEGNMGYHVNERDIKYIYSEKDTFSIYDELELELSAADYDRPDRTGLICPHSDAGNDNCCDICSKNSYNVVVYNRSEKSSDSVTAIQAVPAIYEGEKALVKAPDKLADGYSFLGWYKVTSTSDNKVTEYGDKLSSSLTYSFTVNENTSIVAVYKSNGTAVVNITVNDNEKGYSVNGAEPVKESSQVNIPLGTILTLSAQETDEVYQWKNSNGRVLGTAGTLQLVVTGNMDISLVYKNSKQDKAYVEYVSDSGQIIAYDLIGIGDSISIPDGPTKLGHSFSYWTIDGSIQATADVIKSAVAKAVSNKAEVITIKPYYEKINKICSVTVVSVFVGSADTGSNKIISNLNFGNTTTIAANEYEGYKFKCWAADKEASVILGYSENYFMQVSKDAVLYAIYEKLETELTEQPVINITDMSVVDDSGRHKISCASTRYVPDGYTLVEQGMLFGVGLDALTDDTFVYGNEGVRRYVASDKKNNGVLRLNIGVSDDSENVYCRAYMVVKNEITGNQEYYYSGISNRSYNE